MNRSAASTLILPLVAASSVALAASAQDRSGPQPSPGSMVDALHAAFGAHHARAVHAKGVLAVGEFEPSADAQRLCKAALFKARAVRVLVRFSDFTGLPDIPDAVPQANPRGLALKFTLPDGSTTDVVGHSFNGFPVATAAQFREFLLAVGASPAGAPKPTALDKFLVAHPIAVTFLTTQKPAPASYATLSYFGVNAFRLTAADGKQVYVRYRFVPVAGEASATPETLRANGQDYLVQELPTRLAKGPVSFRWYAQIAQPGDAIDDPSVAWPESRQLVELGVIRIDAMAADQAGADRSSLFLPLNVPDGIVGADPMLGVRQGAYPISFGARQ